MHLKSQYFLTIQAGKDIAVLDSQFYGKFSKDGYKGIHSWHKGVRRVPFIHLTKSIKLLCNCVGGLPEKTANFGVYSPRTMSLDTVGNYTCHQIIYPIPS